MSKADVINHIKKIQIENEPFKTNQNVQNMAGFFIYLNSDPAHFIWEMLQNAEDVYATEITFTLHENNLYVRHNGTPFTESNVNAICSLFKSDKNRSEGKIGKFGAGFKTVYTYCDAPEIYSGDYTFKITHLAYPEYIPVEEKNAIPADQTLFILPFRDPEVAGKDIRKKLSSLSTQSLMFLKRIEKVTVVLDGNPRTIERSVLESDKVLKDCAFEHILIRDTKIDKEYYRFTLSGISVKDKDELTRKIETVENQSVMIAYRLKAGKIIPITPALDIVKYFVYFPTEVESHLKFLAHAPFKTTINRETFSLDIPANETLFKKLMDLVIISTKYLVKKNIVDADFYNQILLPGGAVFPTEYPYEFIKSRLVKEIGKGAAILPTSEKVYCSYPELLIETFSTTEKDIVKKNFSVEEIAMHVEAFRQRKYWDASIYRTNLHRLLNFVREEFDPGENEISLKQLLDYLTPSWLASKTIAELKKFYSIFLTKSYEPSVNFNVIGREKLREIPLVRKPDGHQIKPQKAYWRESDIHPDLMNNEFCRAFLRNQLQIQAYDETSEIQESISLRYRTESVDVSPDVHLSDISAVLNAISKGKLSSSYLASLNIIYAYNAKTGVRSWRKPSEVYLSAVNGGNRDAEILLSGVPDTYFSDIMYERFGDKLAFLGLRESLHVEVSANQSLCGQFVELQIRSMAEFKKGQIYLFPKENFKPNVSLPHLKEIFASSFDAKKSLALYRLLSKNPQFIKGTVEWSTSKTNVNQKSVRHGTMEVFSELGYKLKTMPWIYSTEKKGCLPVRISAQSVLPEYLKDSALLELFEVAGVNAKKLSSWIPPDENVSPEMREFIDRTARYSPEELRMMLENFERPQSVKSVFDSLLEQNNDAEPAGDDEDSDEFEPTPITNLEKRGEKIDEKLGESLEPKKKKGENLNPDDWRKNPKVIKLFDAAASKDERMFFESLGAALGTTLVDFGYADDTTKEERAFLEQEYQGRCQICSARIPKALKPGSKQFPYHYIARNVIKTHDLDPRYRDSQIVEGWNSLCLCPMCAAKYLYCSKDLSTFADQVLNLMINPSERVVYEIKIKLNGKTEIIHYMPKHIYALQRALKYFKAYEEKEKMKKK